MLNRLLVIAMCFAVYGADAQVKRLPLANYYRLQADRVYQGFQDSTDEEKVRRGAHRSFYPLIEENVLGYDEIYRDTSPYRNWFTEKLFGEHLIEIEEKKFELHIDPLFNFNLGHDTKDTARRFLYLNSRGVFAEGGIGEKVSFGTWVYENQARFPTYFHQWVADHGELRPTNNGYKRDNGVVPGAGRTKYFKGQDYDFFYAGGYVSVSPAKQLNLQVGHGSHFIGNGYRSLVLSDNTVNYPYARLTTTWWGGRIQTTHLYASFKNLFRYSAFSTTESLYEPKLGSFHSISYTPIPQLQFSIVEGTVWQRGDSSGVHGLDGMFFMPLPGLASATRGLDGDRTNSVIGLTFNVTPVKGLEVYGQWVVDDFKWSRWGAQVGVKAIEPFGLKGLMAVAEYNHLTAFMYQAEDARRSYSHYNLPLAHPRGAGLDEVMLHLEYRYKRFFLTYRTSFYMLGDDRTDIENFGTDIFKSTDMADRDGEVNNNSSFHDVSFGYLFNPSYGLQTVLGYRGRLYELEGGNHPSHHIYLGLRTQLFNRYYDL